MVVVAAHDGALELVAHHADALGRRGVVAHHVPHAHVMRGALRARIVQHSLKRLDVRVDVTENGVDSSHGIRVLSQLFKTTAAASRRSSTVVIFRFGTSVSTIFTGSPSNSTAAASSVTSAFLFATSA